jgi:two-component system cell cycle sensor histidine kinase/response regulator CckA
MTKKKQTRGIGRVERERERTNESSQLSSSDESAVLSSILAAAPLCVIAYDDAGCIALWNAEAERVLGWRASEVLGKESPYPITELHAGDAPREITRATHGGGSAHLSVTVQRVPLDSGGSITVELGTDLADRKRLEQQVVQGVRLEAVGRLAGGIAHDFNNILAAIKCSCELIGDSLRPNDARITDVRAIVRETSRAAELTRQLLAFTRQQVLLPHVVDLNEVVRGAERILLGILGDQLSLALELAPNSIHVRADAAQLERALIHLVVNAREATPVGGRVTIGTGHGRLERDPTGGGVPIAAGTYGWIEVRDTGRGISRELQGRIFEPFYTTKQRGTGTGLGLSAVYGTVKQSGGYTFVASAPGAGAAFTIYLPLVDSPRTAPPATTGARTSTDDPATILLVDDEIALRGLMRRILERSGYLVLEAEHGAEALAQCESHEGTIDLIVSDVVMPTMGGREMAERLRAIRPRSRLLFVSGFTDDEALREGIVASGADYLQKPFAPATLLAKIAELLHRDSRE